MVMGVVGGHTKSMRSRAASQPAQRFQQVVGYDRYEAFAIYLPQSPQPRLRPPQPVQRCENSLSDGQAPHHLPAVGGSPVPFLGLEVQGVIDAKAQVPAPKYRRFWR